ncbi:MAG: DUF4129 domain-containing protein [Candidatus Obscuribacterales bacterium]|nr:DUF4129 domain-containing protein [Candidatus Obscuribacterales bacterium]
MEYKDVHPQIEQVSKAYQYFDPPDYVVNIQEFIRSAIRAVLEWLHHFGIGGSTTSDSSSAAYLLRVSIYLIGIICTIVVLQVMYRELKAFRLKNKLQESKILASERILSSEQWKAEALTLAQNGDYRPACRALYLAALRLLHETNILSYSAVRTNHEYYYALLNKPNLSGAFNNLASLVELVWFGQDSANQADYENCQHLFSHFETNLSAYRISSTGAST